MRHSGKPARRALAWLVWALLALVLALLLLLAALLTTPLGLRLVVSLGLAYYNDTIAGSVTIDDIGGTLGARFVLRGVMLRDRHGHALVTADALTVAWSPWPLLRGDLVVRELRLDRPRVHLVDPRGEPSAFADLAPPSAPEPDDPHALPGPDLPLDLDVALALRDAAVLGAGGSVVVDALDLDARAQATGRVARLAVRRAHAHLADAPAIRLLRLDARWTAPVVRLDDLRLTADGAALHVPTAELDVRSLRGALDLRAAAATAALAPWLSPGTSESLTRLGDRLDLTAVARGVPEDMFADIALDLAPGLRISLAGVGAWRGAPQADLQLAAELDLTALLGRPLGRVRPVLDLRARPHAADRLALSGDLRCRDCDVLAGLSGGLAGAFDPVRGDLSLQTDLRLAGLTAALDLRLAGGGVHDLDLAVSAPDLARPIALARRFVPTLPTIRGAASARAGCLGPELRCALALDLRRLRVLGRSARAVRLDLRAPIDLSSATAGLTIDRLRSPEAELARAALTVHAARLALAPVAAPPLAALAGLPPVRLDLSGAAARVRGVGERARVDLSVETGDTLRADLRALALDARRLDLSLLAPARLVLAARTLRVDGLRLGVGRGRVRLDGTLDRDGPSDLRLDLDAFELAALRPFLPARLRPAGRASAHVRLHGRPDAPALRTTLAIRRLHLAGGALGTLRLDLRLADDHAAGRLALRTPAGAVITLAADVPLRIDLSRGTGSLVPSPVRVDLRLRDLRLRDLAPWLPRPRLAGHLDGTLALRGDLAAPLITGVWHGRRLAFDGLHLGDLDLALVHRDARLRAAVDLQRRRGGARLDLAAPIALDLARGRVDWDRRGDHRALLRVTDVDLAAQLGPDAPDLAGRLDLRADLSGPATDPALHVVARADRIAYLDLSLGSGILRATMRDGGSELVLDGAGGALGRWHAQALAPIAAGADGLRWRRDGWYAADLTVHALDLADLAPRLGVDVQGRVSAGLALAGAGRSPRLSGHVRADSLAYRDQPAGHLRLDLAHRDGEARVTATGRLGARTDLQLTASVPLDLDLATGDIGWRDDRPTTARLAVTHLDAAALAPLQALPRAAQLDLDLHAHTRIDRDRLHATASLSGVLGGAPLALNLDVAAAQQRLRGRLGGDPRDGRGALTLDASTRIPLRAPTRGPLLAAALDGRIIAKSTDLRPLDALLPDSVYDLVGTLDADLALAGRLGRPDLRGDVHLRRGGVTLVAMQQRLRDLELDLRVDGPKVRLTRLTATSGRGRATATATATIGEDTLAARADLSLEQFPLVRPGLPQMLVDARVRADVADRPDRLAVDVAVADAKVWVSQLTTRAPATIPSNANVHIVTLTTPTPPATSAAPPSTTAFTVTLADPVHIEGPTMDMHWAGRIAARGDDVTGAFTSDRGRFELLGNQFRIDRGRVFLPPEGATVDPFLDLVATTHTDQYDVAVTLRGRLSRPELALSSTPSLTEPQVFSLLVTGAVDSSASDPRKTQASAAGLLLNFSNPTLSRFADQRLGIDRIRLGFADDIHQPVLTLGKYLSKSLYAETTYHHHAPPRQNRIEGRVEYLFSPAWTLETTYGDAAVGSVDIFWRHVFGLAPGRTPRLRGDPSASSTATSSPTP